MHYEILLATSKHQHADALEKLQQEEFKASGKTRKEFFSDIHQAYRRTTIKYIRACVAELEAKIDYEKLNDPK